MPVPPVAGTAEGAELLGGPGDHVRGARSDLLTAPGAQVRLGGGRPGHGPDPPVAVRVLLELPTAVEEARLEIARRGARTAGAVAAGHEVQCRWRRAQWREEQPTRRGPVPRYDVRCRACGTTFEVNRPMARADEPAPCPSGHDDTVRLLPTVGLTGRSGGTRTATAPAPAAGGGGCCG